MSKTWYIQADTEVNTVYTIMYLWNYQVTNHEGKSLHQHFHAVGSHHGILLAINVNVVKVGRVLRGQGDH
jgi:hypothetical protein